MEKDIYGHPKYTTDCYLYVIYEWANCIYRTYAINIEKIESIIITPTSKVGIGYKTTSGRFVTEENINKLWEFDNREQAHNQVRRKLGLE